MMIKKRNWLSLMAYLIIASVVAIFLGFLLLQICVELFFLIFYGLSFQMSNIDFWKCLKAGLGGGVVAAIGCWWIYYQHYKKTETDSTNIPAIEPGFELKIIALGSVLAAANKQASGTVLRILSTNRE